MSELLNNEPSRENNEKIKRIVNQSPPEQLIWAWQNFVKRIVLNKISDEDCRRLLLQELEEPLPEKHNLRSLLYRTNPDVPISNEKIEDSVLDFRERILRNLIKR